MTLRYYVSDYLQKVSPSAVSLAQVTSGVEELRRAPHGTQAEAAVLDALNNLVDEGEVIRDNRGFHWVVKVRDFIGTDVLADLRITEGPPEMIGMVPDYNRAEADRRLRHREGNSAGYCRDCGLPVWWREERLITSDGERWCFGPNRSRVAMERWHALPGMAQYVVPSPEGRTCHCLDRAYPHIHQIVRAED